MDRLTRITLINWYLFGSIDIDIKGDSTLFRGLNGVGKSSILDALQTVLSGGDENLMLMNAASSDGKRSGRTLRSYILGEVAESPSHAASESRTETNSYICLTYNRKRDEGTYSYGVAFHAKQTSSSPVKKNHFLLDNGKLSRLDFMLDEHTVMPWDMFTQRLTQLDGKAYLPSTASEYRDLAAELMSAKGARHLISSKMMFRAIKNGLAFKEEKSMSDFCHKFILPECNIDVLRIQNDFSEFTKIQETIQEAKARLDSLDKIIAKLGSYASKHKLALGYEWAEHESTVTSADEAIELMQEQLNEKTALNKTLDSLSKELHATIPKLQNARDRARDQWVTSDESRALQNIEDGIATKEAIVAGAVQSIADVRRRLGLLEQVPAPIYFSNTQKKRYEQIQQELMGVTHFAMMSYEHTWPATKGDIVRVEGILDQFTEFINEAEQEHREVFLEHSGLELEIGELERSLSEMSQGEASLTTATKHLMMALENSGIASKPVCDLAEITDPYWQRGIEGFLGGNRESLILLDTHGNPELNTNIVERAIEIFRREKESSPLVRRAKLVNPDKLPLVKPEQVEGFAAGLIQSKNAVALQYLTGLLKNVTMVESEMELRKATRAISPDGMVVGNGSIGGGAQIQWLLIGEKARKESAKELTITLAHKTEHNKMLTQRLGETESVKNHFKNDIPNLIAACVREAQVFDANKVHIGEIEALKNKRKALENSPESHLEETYKKADSLLAENILKKDESVKNTTILSYEITQLSDAIQKRIFIRTESGKSRTTTEEQPGFDQIRATECMERLIDKHGEFNHDDIKLSAQKEAKSNQQSSLRDKEDGLKMATEYSTTFNTDDREEIRSLDAIALLERCKDHARRITDTEIVLFHDEAIAAQERMLKSFRSEIVAKLKENFLLVETTFNELNRALSGIVFNGNKYKFKHPLNEVPTLQLVYEYTIGTDDIEATSSEGLFATRDDHPAIKIIQEILNDGRLHEISDYRNFFEYDLISTSVSTNTDRGFKELIAKGSGGEKGTPFYVALGASFMTTYKIRMAGGQAMGGAALAVFDEAFSKIDGSNAKAALKFFSEIGLQVILAAPPESEIKIGPFVDKTYNVIRSGDAIHLDHKQYSDKGKYLLRSDDPHENSEIVEKKVNDISSEFYDE